MRSRIARSLVVVALASGLAACSSVSLDDKAGQSGSGAASGQIMDPFNPQSVLAQQRSVYFDFDSYTVGDQYRGLVETHAKYLVSAPQQRVTIEGNTDARGGSEYNLALGQRRAESVKNMMRVLGVPEGQLEAVSYGKEKPKATGTSDADNAQNRRADVAYDGE